MRALAGWREHKCASAIFYYTTSRTFCQQEICTNFKKIFSQNLLLLHKNFFIYFCAKVTKNCPKLCATCR